MTRLLGLACLVIALGACDEELVPFLDQGVSIDQAVPLDMTSGEADGGEPVSCPVPFSPCGGDVVGVWRVIEDCVPFTNESCPDAALMVDQRAPIIYTFNDDGSFTRDETGETKYHFTEPVTCLPSSATSCDELANMSGGLSSTCSGDITVECRCDVTLSSELVESGTYSVAGNALFAQPTMGAAFGFDYCVDGTHLLLNAPALPSPILLERQ